MPFYVLKGKRYEFMKVKKWLLGLVTFAAMVVLCTIAAGAETCTYGDYEYRVRDKDQTVYIMAYTGKEQVVNIPEQIDGKKVTGIAEYAFSNDSIEIVNIPNTVTVLFGMSFSKCNNLREINIPESVSDIKSVPVVQCPSVEKINVSEKNNYYRSVDGVLFSNDMSLLIYYPSNKAGDSYKVPDEVTEFPDNINCGVFNYNQNLKSITINASVNLFTDYFVPLSQFDYASKLEAIYVDSKNPYLTTDNGILYSKDKTILVSYPANCSQTKYVMPDNVCEMSFNAFYGAKNLKEIWLSEKLGVNISGATYFLGCRNLESINVPESNSTFYSVDGVLFGKDFYSVDGFLFGKDDSCLISYPQNKKDSKYEVPTTVKSIVSEAFEGNTNLSTVIIPDNVTEINGSAFMDCTSLSKVVLPSNLKEIAYYTFSNCSSLTDIDIPASITTVGACAFLNCSSLKNVTIPFNVTEIMIYAFGYRSESPDFNVYQKKNNFKIYCYSGTAGEQYAKDNGFDYELLEMPTLSKVTGVKLGGRAADALRINWTKNASADGYIVEMYQGNKWVRIAKITSNNTTTFRKAGLKAGTAYKFRVRAYKMSGNTAVYGAYSATVAARTNPSVIKGAKLTGRAADALRIKWTKNTTADGYIVEMYKGGKWVRAAKITKNSTTTYRASGLKASTVYKFRVRAYKMSGSTALYGNYSATVTARTNPSIVKGVKIGGKAKDALRVNWTKNASAQGYIVEMYKGGKWVRVAKITNGNTTTFRKAGLAKNTAYKFRVKAYYMSGKTALYGNYGSVSGKTAAK